MNLPAADDRSFSGYFPISLVKSCDIPANRKYVFGYHPHGIIGMGAIANFGTEGTSNGSSGQHELTHADTDCFSNWLFRPFPWPDTASPHSRANFFAIGRFKLNFSTAHNKLPYSVLSRYTVSCIAMLLNSQHPELNMLHISMALGICSVSYRSCQNILRRGKSYRSHNLLTVG